MSYFKAKMHQNRPAVALCQTPFQTTLERGGKGKGRDMRAA